jgi:O-antigen/teichoic acid export membrane protein
MLYYFQGDAQVGWYSAAYRLLEGLYLFPKIIANVLYPAFSRTNTDRAAVSRLYQRALRYVFLIAFPLIAVGVVAAEDVTLLIFGDQYLNAVGALQILLLGVMFVFMHEVLFVLLAAVNRQRISLAFAGLALAVNVSLNLVLIPRIGHIGAATAMAIAEGVFVGAGTLYLAIRNYRIGYLSEAIKPLASAIVAGIAAYLLRGSLALLIPITLAGYLAVLTALSFWDADEKAVFARVRQRVKRS